MYKRQPLATHAGVRPELLVLATGTGSLFLSHVNDSGFWIVQSFFKMELKETLATWSAVSYTHLDVYKRQL